MNAIMAAPARLSVAPILRKALAAKDELRLQPEAVDGLASLYCSVQVNEVATAQMLARRELDLSRALTQAPSDSTVIQALITEINKLRTDLEARAITALESLRKLLTSDQFSKVLSLYDVDESYSLEITTAVESYLDQKLKDKDVVEVEIASKVADRLLNWTKVFAFFIAIPASIIIIGLTVVGIEKVSDMNTVIKNGENQLQETLKAAIRMPRQSKSESQILKFIQINSLRNLIAKLKT